MLKFIDKDGQQRRGILVTCESCKKEFPTRKDQIRKYCSTDCRGLAERNRASLECAYCKIPFQRSKSKLQNSRSGYHFCSRACKDQAQKIGGVAAIMPPHYGTGAVDYRKLFEPEELICVRCGYCEFDCGVDIHHIDGDRTNNEKENLVPLCKCCHIGLHNRRWSLQGPRV